MAHTREDRMPALFLAHGNPMNAIATTDFTRSLEALAADLPVPEAVLVVSAHWLTRGTGVLATDKPRTIHDFGGFPRELYEIEYPAPGAPAFAERVAGLLPMAQPDVSWGLDHGAWTILRHMYPNADVPVFELSLDVGLTPDEHWDVAERLGPLRDEGVLVVGSGNIVHSFDGMSWERDAPAHSWAVDFDDWVAEALARRDREALTGYESLGLLAEMAAPTNDHYLPMLYAAALCTDEDEVTSTHVGIENASMSMRCVRFG